jgi:hypothetical protein
MFCFFPFNVLKSKASAREDTGGFVEGAWLGKRPLHPAMLTCTVKVSVPCPATCTLPNTSPSHFSWPVGHLPVLEGPTGLPAPCTPSQPSIFSGTGSPPSDRTVVPSSPLECPGGLGRARDPCLWREGLAGRVDGGSPTASGPGLAHLPCTGKI